MSKGRHPNKRVGECSRPETQAAMDQLMATFSDEDGSYLEFARFVQEIDEKAANGDQAAIEILLCLHRVHKLILIANRQEKK